MRLDRDTHRVNYRIAFDAMRAYHTSEIEHKKDMITILNSILLVIVSIYAGIYYYIIYVFPKSNKSLLIIGILIILLCCTLLALLINSLKKQNNAKIKSDNDHYESFREECRIERDLLGLTKTLKKKNQNIPFYWEQIKEIKKDRDGTGYLKTIKIISMYCTMLLIMVFAMTILGIVLLTKQYFGY